MTIHIHWENDAQTIIRWQFDGSWNWNDFELIQNEFHDMLKSVDHPVDVIADMRSSPLLPRDAFANFRRMERRAHQNRNRIVLVTESVFIRSMAHTFNEVFRHRPTRFLLARDIEEAYARLEEPAGVYADLT